MHTVVRAAGASAGHLTLDIAEKQILQYYDDDAHFLHHHRILFHMVSPAVWVVGTVCDDRMKEIVYVYCQCLW